MARAARATATVDQRALLARVGMAIPSMGAVEVADTTAEVAEPVSSVPLNILDSNVSKPCVPCHGLQMAAGQAGLATATHSCAMVRRHTCMYSISLCH